MGVIPHKERVFNKASMLSTMSSVSNIGTGRFRFVSRWRLNDGAVESHGLPSNPEKKHDREKVLIYKHWTNNTDTAIRQLIVIKAALT